MRAPYQVISADSHLEISFNRWRDRVPAKYRDRAPRTVLLPDGTDANLMDDGRLHPVNGASTLCAGKPFEEWRQEGAQYETSAGAGSPEQRLREQDQDGIDAEVLYPSVNAGDVLHGIRDDDAYHAVVRAYNEWLAEEYCAVAPDRLIGLGVIPQRGIEQAIAEMEHCAKLGLKGVWIGKYPNGGMRPAPEDDEFWAASLEMNMPVTAHEDFIDHGPKRAHYARYGHMFNGQWGLPLLERRPSEYLRSQNLWGFLADAYGVSQRDVVGVDKLMWGSDFPHSATDWPNSQATVERNFAGVPEHERHLMLAGNAARFFHLDEG